MLASSAVLGIVVGFAARQTLANAIAGILLAITQPIRIGDLVTFEERDRRGRGHAPHLHLHPLRRRPRLIVPNERLAQSTIQNHTIIDPRVQVEVVGVAPAGRRRSNERSRCLDRATTSTLRWPRSTRRRSG